MRDSPLSAGVPLALAQLRRHWLVWPSHAGIDVIERQIPDAGCRGTVRKLLGRDCPLVVRRHADAIGNNFVEPQDSIAAGMVLPLSHDRRRIGFWLPRDSVARAALPCSLAYVASAVRAPWRQDLQALQQRAIEQGIEFRVYGSAMWEALTGEAYLTSESDVDLLWQPRTECDPEVGIALLLAWEKDTSRRADGEIVFGDAAVAWREWKRVSGAGAGARVLAKKLCGAELIHPSLLCRPQSLS